MTAHMLQLDSIYRQMFKNLSIIHRLMLLPERVHCEAAVMLSMHLELRENTCMGSNLRLQLCCSACWSSLFRLWEHKRRSRMWSHRLSKQTSPRGPDTWQPWRLRWVKGRWASMRALRRLWRPTEVTEGLADKSKDTREGQTGRHLASKRTLWSVRPFPARFKCVSEQSPWNPNI